MTFDLEIDGASTTVTIEAAGSGRYAVVVDGTRHDVLAEPVGEFGLSVILGGASHASRELHVAPGSARGDWLVSLDGRSVPVAANGRSRRRGAAADAGAAGARPVVAPMPGRVVRVLVSPGDAVQARQGVVVVEAMKMENELRAPKAGTVREVNVAVGASVEAGRVLVVVE
jgi:acetyl/propionyl-CoA carboxylase alpha subunit